MSAPWSFAGLVFMALLVVLTLLIHSRTSCSGAQLGRWCFWFFGIILVIFTFFRPIGLARDDFGYIDFLNKICPEGDCSKGEPIRRDFVWYYLVTLGANFGSEGMLKIGMFLSAVGVSAKLVLIDKLCTKRLLALVLFVPLCYVQYDLTQMRAGFAISWMLLGVFFLVRYKLVFATALLFANPVFHLQAVFSPGLLIYRLFGVGRYILFFSVLFFLLLIYLGLYPNEYLLRRLGFTSEYIPYAEDFSQISAFPLGYLPILLYGIWLCNTLSNGARRLGDVVSASVFTAIVLAWFFSLLPVMQTRFFEFYVVPLVFVAGNINGSAIKIYATLCLAIVLYLRLELLNDWILG